MSECVAQNETQSPANSKRKVPAGALLLILFVALASVSCERLLPPDPPASSAAFVVHRPEPGFRAPEIVLQYDAAAGTGVNWPAVNHPQWHEATPPIMIGRAANYLREGLQRMTGKELSVTSKADLSAGIVLTLFKNAPDGIRHDPEVRQALQADPKDPYAANEAFFIRSETNRVLVVANTPDGLADAVVELLESVDYEILGMGPDWIYAPDYKARTLVFALKRAGRPSYYIRLLGATSGQSNGNGTLKSGLTDPADETVDVSYIRWLIGARLYGQSMPAFPGHALQAYHKPVIERMKQTGATDGLLAPRTVVGPEAQRPAADPENKGWIWICNDPAEQPGAIRKFISDGKTWLLMKPSECGWNLDLSVPFVRQIIFASLTNRATAGFAQNPDDPFVFGMDAEDGAPGNAVLDQRMKHKNWYPEYLEREGAPFGQPYVLHGYKGLSQPKEIWDSAAASDNMFGLANWLLREFDKWIDSLPPAQRVTSSAKSKKDLIRCSFLSYNYHDVPPNFNPDPRIRVMIAGYPKHRGRGKWEKLVTHEDVALALKVMLPREPMADYRIFSFAYYMDPGPDGIPALRNVAPAALAADYRRAYDAGIRAMNCEVDFNSGKYGLGYYLIAKMLWNAKMTAQDLAAIRDRWFQRAFGGAWREMKAYYDFMLPDNYPVNGPNSWARAIRLIDAADRKIDGAKEPDAQRRIDDVKQYWYCHYLMDSGKYAKHSPELLEYLWKGQMSYMVAMHVPATREYGAGAWNLKDVVGAEISAGPAHYTHAETQVWWANVLGHWKLTPVTMFGETTLANGKPAKAVDLNDLVMVREFQNGSPDSPFFFRADYVEPLPFLTSARQKDDPLGFKLVWQFITNDASTAARKVPYGVDIWDPVRKTWDAWIDKTTVFQQSEEITNAKGEKLQVVDVRLKSPRAGTYRFDIDYCAGAWLASAAYDPATGAYTGTNTGAVGFTYCTAAAGFTLSPAYFYIPKGVKSLDLEVWYGANYKVKTLQLYRGLPARNATPSRKIDVGAMGTYTIALQSGEDGAVARVEAVNLALPYFYSIPTFWANSPAALLIPRAIAEADGLTILK